MVIIDTARCPVRQIGAPVCGMCTGHEDTCRTDGHDTAGPDRGVLSAGRLEEGPVATAEHHKIKKVFTLDRPDLLQYRSRHCTHFTIVP